MFGDSSSSINHMAPQIWFGAGKGDAICHINLDTQTFYAYTCILTTIVCFLELFYAYYVAVLLMDIDHLCLTYFKRG